MEKADIQALINTQIAGQGSAVDIGGALPKVLAELLNRAAPVKVENIEDIDGEVLEALAAGDKVIKVDSTGEHAYICTFKGAGGLSLSYFDCDNVETLAYTKSESGWAFDDKTITPISTIRG